MKDFIMTDRQKPTAEPEPIARQTHGGVWPKPMPEQKVRDHRSSFGTPVYIIEKVSPEENWLVRAGTHLNLRDQLRPDRSNTILTNIT